MYTVWEPERSRSATNLRATQGREKEGESFSDVVNRISPDVRLEDYWGILDDEVAEELWEAVTDGRDWRHETRAVRRDRIVTELSSDDANSEQ